MSLLIANFQRLKTGYTFYWSKKAQRLTLQTKSKLAMKKRVCQGSFIVLNDKGLHARPCSELVKLAARFTSKIWVEYGSRKVDAKSLLGLLTLAISAGSEVRLIAEGSDAQEAIHEIESLASNRFYHHY